MAPSSSKKTVVDGRGFMFKLPHLGLPDPTGELVLVKCAIGTKADALEKLVHDKTLKAPLRREDKDAQLVAFDFQGALWALPLLAPAPSPTSPPQFFTLKVRRMFPDAMEFPRAKLPDYTDWIFYPMSVYQQHTKREGSSTYAKKDNGEPEGYLFQIGRASETKDAVKREQEEKKRRSRPKKEVSEWETLSMNIFDDDWKESVQLQAMLEASKLGDKSVLGQVAPSSVIIRLGILPAPNNDYRGLKYALCREDEPGDAKLPASRWRPLPPEATKPGAERHVVNRMRKGEGHKPFTKEEWDQMPHPPE